MITLVDAIAKLQRLSENRAALVISLIDELSLLEEHEDAEDLAAARAVLADGEPTIPWEQVKAELNALHVVE